MSLIAPNHDFLFILYIIPSISSEKKYIINKVRQIKVKCIFCLFKKMTMKKLKALNSLRQKTRTPIVHRCTRHVNCEHQPISILTDNKGKKKLVSPKPCYCEINIFRRITNKSFRKSPLKQSVSR